MSRLIVRVTLPHLCAGVIVQNDIIVSAAPILKWALGQSLENLTRWVLSKKGDIEVVTRQNKEAL